MKPPRILVIGGGISGLSHFRGLLEAAREGGRPIDAYLAEAGDRLGGTIETEKRDGFILEKGPDSFITDKPWALELSKKIGIESELLGTNPLFRRSFVARLGKIHAIPEGFYMVAPLDAGAFLKSPIFSWTGKARMMMEPLIPAMRGSADESVASFVRRRFGREALERVGQPMLAGVYTGDPESLSIRATLGRFADLESKYGSVTRGLLSEVKKRKSAAAQASGPRYSLFTSFKNGMQTFRDAIVSSLPAERMRTRKPVKRFWKEAGSVSWSVLFEDGTRESFDYVTLALPARHAGAILSEAEPELSKSLSSFRYESVATLNLAYDRGQIGHVLDGFGFVVPRTENSVLIASSFSSQKFVGRAPEGKVLLRAFIGGAFGKKHLEAPDTELIRNTHQELARYLGIQGDPLFSALKRYPETMIQYEVGHLEKVAGIRKLLTRVGGLSLIGSNYGGIGIPDCVREAELEAKKIVDAISPTAGNPFR